MGIVTDVADKPAPSAAADDKKAAPIEKKPKKRRSRWRVFGVVLLVLVVILGIGRAMMPTAVRWYVNRTIDKNPLYEGKIGDIDIHLWRGAYTIHDIRLLKTTGNVPVPFFSAKQLDLAIEWDAILHRPAVCPDELQQYSGFNVVLTNSVLHHLLDPVAAMQELEPLLSADAVWLCGHEPSRRFIDNPACRAAWPG